jgi:hypothetical protein
MKVASRARVDKRPAGIVFMPAEPGPGATTSAAICTDPVHSGLIFRWWSARVEQRRTADPGDNRQSLHSPPLTVFPKRLLMQRKTWLVAGLLLLGAIGAIFVVTRGAWRSEAPVPVVASYEDLTGSVFSRAPQQPSRPPIVRELTLPQPPDAKGIWGATGRDQRGHIWFGVSAESPGHSAHLLEFDPQAAAWYDRGSVLDQLKAAGLYSAGEGQGKIHSKIVPAADGWLYFASMDEEGETVEGAVPPRWGGHLWRIQPETHRWQHLLAVPEGLIAVSGVGRYMYALGYWGHVLYQYDTATGASKRVVVGSAVGHVSRNFLADVRGHAYVPRLAAQSDGKVSAALVEYDGELKKVASTPLEFYLGGTAAPQNNDGIVGLAYLADGRLLFTTHRGQLYLIEPKAGGPAAVEALGWFHPDGEAYAPSLFALDGDSLIAGVTQRGGTYQWVVFELKTHIARAFALDTKGLRSVLLYGSVTRDNAGRAYVGGWASRGTGDTQPLVLQIDPS